MQSGIATLPFDFMRLAASIRSKVAVCENVPALATRYPDVLDNIRGSLRFEEGGLPRYYAFASVLADAQIVGANALLDAHDRDVRYCYQP